MDFLRFLKLSTDARHTQTCSLAQSYSPPLTVSGNTSTVFKKSKTGSSVFKERQWWEACTGSATPLKRKKYSQNSASNRLGNIFKKEVINLQPIAYDWSSIILKHLNFSESIDEFRIAHCIGISQRKDQYISPKIRFLKVYPLLSFY